MITKDSKRILFADDSEFYSARFNEILTEAGHKTQTVNNGKEVIEALKTNSEGINLLILELDMPEADGYEVLSWIRDNNLSGRFPVLAVTGVYEPTHILKRLQAFVKVSLITKTLSPEQFIHKVNQLLFPDKFARGEPRIPISIPVDCNVEGVTFRGNLLNLSATGLFLHTVQELQKGTLVNLKFHLPGYDITIDVNGLIVWSTDLSEEDSFFGGAGIQFLDIFSKEQEILRKFVTKELKKLGLNE
jgi:uncharacterized protein (TIGR02266 family)